MVEKNSCSFILLTVQNDEDGDDDVACGASKLESWALANDVGIPKCPRRRIKYIYLPVQNEAQGGWQFVYHLCLSVFQSELTQNRRDS